MKLKFSGFLFCFSLTCLTLAAQADVLTPQQALSRAKESISPRATRATESPVARLAASSLRHIYTAQHDDLPTCYLFSAQEGGFLLVSACEGAQPVLGYADHGDVSATSLPPALTWWMEEYGREIAAAQPLDAASSSNAQLTPHSSSLTPHSSLKEPIAPLISTHWDQPFPYNQKCPSGCLTGCVATAMAQIMKFHEWPQQGKSWRSYKWNGSTLFCDFSQINFQWDLMPDICGGTSSAEERDAVAELMWACGASVETNYSTTASAAYNSYVPYALINYFQYDRSCAIARRDYYTTSHWEALVYDQLAQHLPVFYTGTSAKNEGHAFVCDGYDDEGLFHFNWGWSGRGDGYFRLSALNPKEYGAGVTAAGYNTSQAIVYNIRPTLGTASPKEVETLHADALDTTQSSVALGESVTLTGAFWNDSQVPLGGILGARIEWAQEDQQIHVDGTSLSMLLPNYKVDEYALTIPETLEEGEYRLHPAYHSEKGSWSDILVRNTSPQWLVMKVAGGKATFSAPKGYRAEALDLQVPDHIILGQEARIGGRLQNLTSRLITSPFRAFILQNATAVRAYGDIKTFSIEAYDDAPLYYTARFLPVMQEGDGQTEEEAISSFRSGFYTLRIGTCYEQGARKEYLSDDYPLWIGSQSDWDAYQDELSGIQPLTTPHSSLLTTHYYTLDGRLLHTPSARPCLKREQFSDGSHRITLLR